MSHSVRSRRTHNKSRLGCRNCKRRRIKCDEDKPSCSNCLSHAISCDFIELPAAPVPATSDLDRHSGNTARNYRFKPSRYQTRLRENGGTGDNETLATTTLTTTSSAGTQCDMPASSDGLSLADLQLFHHFVVSTYRTVVENEDGHTLWQVNVPELSMTNSSILHLLLAFSALHRAYEQSDSQTDLRDQYVAQADQHFSFGVSSVTAILSQFELVPENAQPLYLSAILICFLYFARSPQPGEYLVFSANGQAEWLILLRGVRIIVATQKQNIFTGIMAPKDPDAELKRKQHISSQWQEIWEEDRRHLQEMQYLVNQETVDPTRKAMYVSLLDALKQTFEDVYVKMSACTERIGLMQHTIGWMYRLDEEYIDLLQQKDPCALIILAYWSILLRYMEPVWFMRGWASHVVTGVSKFLPLDWQEWISWPVRRIHAET